MNKQLHYRLLVGLLMALGVCFGLQQVTAAQDLIADQPPNLSDEALYSVQSTIWTFGTPPDPQYFWATIWITNHNSEPVTVFVDAYDAKGNLLGSGEILEIASEKLAAVSTANLNGIIPVGAAKVRITSGAAIVASEVAGAMKGNWTTVLHGIPDDDEKIISSEAAVRPMVSGCCGYSSSDNPYPCCGSLGNCTWWAWKQAKGEWDKKLPNWGNAGKWAGKARAAGYPVKSSPSKNSMGVNTWVAGYGHVAWVRSVSGSTVTVSEMNYCSTCRREKTYPASWFNGGYIHKK